VAIKVSGARYSERFEREARLVASLNHPNICQLHDVGPNYLVMELVEGPTLAERIRQGPVPLDEALAIARQISEALEAAHEKGRVHRDLKPANIKITPEGMLKLLDFGLAKVAEEPTAGGDPSESPTKTISPTRTGVILGTAAYMSPEQARGSAVDKRADIWAFGCVLFEMLAGKAAFEGESTSDVLAAVLRAEPDWGALPAATPARIRKLLRRCVERDRKQRLRDIGEARIAIDAPEAEEAPPRTSPRVWPWALALAIALCFGAVGWWWRATRPAPLRRLVRLSAGFEPGTLLDRFRGTWPVISPDGTRIVIAESEPSGKWRLATRGLDQSQFVILPGTERAWMPFFSPDGQWVGFFADGKLKKMPVQGGGAVTLCDATGLLKGASWSDDGIIVAGFNGAGLLEVSAGGGAPTVLTRLSREKGETSHGWPQILPGAETVLFTAYGGEAFDDSEIDAISLKTGERRTVYKGGFFGRYLSDGHLVFLRRNILYAAPFDLRRLVLTAAPQPVIEEVNGNVNGGGDIDFSRNGAVVYVRTKGPSFRHFLAWLDSKGRGQPIETTPGIYESPRFSPDGKRLAYSLPAGPVQADIWVKDIERGTVSRLTHLPGRSNVPLWTPDGRGIVFVATHHNNPGLYWIRADGTGEAQLLKSERLFPSSFSPDGKRLAYALMYPDRHAEIWTAPLEGDSGHPRFGKPEAFLRTSYAEMYPVFSPDGHWLAYTSNESGTFELYVRPFPGPEGKLQVSTGGGSYPVWAHKQHQLFFLTPDWGIMVLDYAIQNGSFVPGRPRLWGPKGLEFLGGNYPYDLGPDDERFAVVQDTAPAEQEQRPTESVVVLLNFFDELRRRISVGGK
jgi:serine/threonine-protein kinase